MTRPRTTPPMIATVDRYDSDSQISDEIVNVFGGNDDVDPRRESMRITPEGASSHPRASLKRAATKLIDHLNQGEEEYLDVGGVSKLLRIPRAAAHGILDVLEVFQIIIPRGPMFMWRGTNHVPLLVQSDKFQAGASMQTGIAVPKVCRAMIPHLRDNVGVEFTAETMAKWLWEAQDVTEAIATIAEADAQQLRALAALVMDVLAVIEALGYINFASCPERGVVYLFNPHSQTQLISPKGMQQSSRMRNMRVMFDGPAPTPTLRPGTSASNRSHPRSAAASARPYTAAAVLPSPRRGRARPSYTGNLAAASPGDDPTKRSVGGVRTGRTPPPPPRSYTIGSAPFPRPPRAVYAAVGPSPSVAPQPQPTPYSHSSSDRSWRVARMPGSHAETAVATEDCRSGVYPTTSEWCSMQQELVARVDIRDDEFDGACGYGTLESDSPDTRLLVCEDAPRPGMAHGGMGAHGGDGYSDMRRTGRVDGGSRGGEKRFALSYGLHTAGPSNPASNYRRQGHPGKVGQPVGAVSKAPEGQRGRRGSSVARHGSGVAAYGNEVAPRGSSVGPRGNSVGPRDEFAPSFRQPGGESGTLHDIDSRKVGGVAKLKHMFETTRMSRIGGFGGSNRVHHMVQRYEGGDA